MGGWFLDIFIEYLYRVLVGRLKTRGCNAWLITKATVTSSGCPTALCGCPSQKSITSTSLTARPTRAFTKRASSFTRQGRITPGCLHRGGSSRCASGPRIHRCRLCATRIKSRPLQLEIHPSSINENCLRTQSIVISRLKKVDSSFASFVNQPMFLSYPSRPTARQQILQRLRFPDATERVT